MNTTQLPLARSLGAWAAFVAAATASSATAQVTFSIDHRSPTTAGPITPADILMPAAGVPALGPLPPPVIVIPGGPGGLGIASVAGCMGAAPGVPCPAEVDALSYGLDGPVAAGMPPGAWKYSVGRGAISFPTPFAPNVFSETPAPIFEGAADVFVDTGLPAGPICPGVMALVGNVGLIDGNGLAGPSPFQYPGLGLIEPHGPNCVAPASPGDNLDALDVDGPMAPPAYISLDAAGVDVCGFPRPGTGPANGFAPGAVLMKFPGPGAPAVYAPPGVLGLDLFGAGTDDLDALAIFENGAAGYMPSPGPYMWAPFAAPDMLLFSVTATSAVVGAPSSNCGAPIAPGDILIPPIPGGLSPFPAILISAESLGLATVRGGFGANDELDALDVTRFPVRDCNANGIEDAVDIATGGIADCNLNGVPDSCEFTMSTYCTAGTTTNGCNATIAGVGTPTASLSCPFSLVITNVEGAKQGIVFYGVSGPLANPWAPGSTSFLCVKSPVQRMGAQSSGGTAGACNGVLSEDWNAYHTANPGSLGQPFFAGQQFNAQAWFRDPPAPSTTNLSDGLQFTTAP